MAISNLTTQYISASFQSLMQVSSSGLIYNGIGTQVTNLVLTSITASFNGLATSASSAILANTATSASVAATVTTAAQPTITSVGTLTGLEVAGNVSVAGTLTANTYILSSSVTSMTVEFASGSTAFGNSSDDTHKFIGSVIVTGSLVVSGSSTFRNIGPAQFTGSVISTQGFTGSLQGTASIATNVAYSGLTGTVPTWNQNTTGNAATATSASTATNVAYTGLTGAVPTWNQNTTGNAATATSASTATSATSATTATTASFISATFISASVASSGFGSSTPASASYSISSSYALSASNAANASTLVSGNGPIMTFYTAGQVGNPEYVFGGDSATTFNLYARSALNVATATTASYISPTFISASAAAAGFGGAAVSASYAATASYVLQAVSASFATLADTATTAGNATTASFAATASYSISSSYSIIASNADTATLAVKASALADSAGGANGTAMNFSSNGIAGQPTYLWGGDSGYSFNLYNPALFTNVSSSIRATTAATASYISPTFISASAAASGFGTGGGAVGTGSVTINNNTDNNLVTATGTANTFNGENSLTFNGSVLALTGALTVTGGITGSLQGTATTASYINPTFISASAAASGFGTGGGGSVSASYAATASFAILADTATTSTTATNADKIDVSSFNSSPGTCNVLLTSATSGYVSIGVDTTTLTYSPSTGIFGTDKITATNVSATSFTGSLQGTATTASYISGSNVIGAVSNSNALNGNADSYYTNASNISSGTISNSYLPAAINITSVTASFKGNLVGTASIATNVAYSGLTGTVPTWNQNTSGNATTATTATTATNVAFSGITSIPAGISITGVAAVENLANVATASLLTNGTFYSVDASIKPINILLDEGSMPLGTEFTFFAIDLTYPITFTPDGAATIISENGYKSMYGTGSAATAKLITVAGNPIWALIGSLKA